MRASLLEPELASLELLLVLNTHSIIGRSHAGQTEVVVQPPLMLMCMYIRTCIKLTDTCIYTLVSLKLTANLAIKDLSSL